jgi:hypothetical protein
VVWSTAVIRNSDKAIKHLLAEVEKNGYTPPKHPKYPNCKSMGITPEDK